MKMMTLYPLDNYLLFLTSLCSLRGFLSLSLFLLKYKKTAWQLFSSCRSYTIVMKIILCRFISAQAWVLNQRLFTFLCLFTYTDVRREENKQCSNLFPSCLHFLEDISWGIINLYNNLIVLEQVLLSSVKV